MADEPRHDEEEGAAADATPAKRFFIYMLIKDIELVPAVVDLVDNSVDAARALNHRSTAGEGDEAPRGTARPSSAEGNGVKPLSGYWIDVTADASQFQIRDNSGGIPLQMAERYAFRFGRTEDFPGSPLAVGQFGVGMKRALFKLGTRFSVTSITEQTRFVLPVDVPEWERDPDPHWRFVFSEADPSYTPEEGDVLGTNILVDRLHPSVSEDFGSPGMLGRLRVELELRHQSALDDGLIIRLNNQPLRPSRPELALSDYLAPIHIVREIPADGTTVRMELYAGVARPSGSDVPVGDQGEAEDYASVPDAGWYLFCNNRLLLAADSTPLTGWGDGANAYHPQYRNFRGYVYLDGDSALLPWNTTKTSVDRDSAVFRLAKAQMVTALRAVQVFLNKAKDERQQVPEADRLLAPALSQARSAVLRDIPLSDVMVYPEPPPRKREEAARRITYGVPKDDFDLVAKVLGTDSPAEVGRQTFQFFLENQVDR